MRKIAILLTALLAIGLLAAMAGPAAAAENPVGPDDKNPNWTDSPGGNDCTTGHGNPASGYDSPDVTDDCGVENGEATR